MGLRDFWFTPTTVDVVQLRQDVKGCQRCALHKHCREPVPGVGPVDAKIVLIGEAPGSEEDQEGMPFVGRSGRLLRSTLCQSDIDPAGMYITNTVKCYPPACRTPTPAERSTCVHWLVKELELVNPKLVIPVGATAYAMFGSGRITEEQGRLRVVEWDYKRFYVYPLLHPAAALRRRSWHDQFRVAVVRLSSLLSGLENRARPEDVFDDLLGE